MTATQAPGVSTVEDGTLISTSPATGAEVGRFPVADEADVHAAVARARDAQAWWAGLGFAERRKRLLRWDSLVTQRVDELAALIHRETGKPLAEAVVETVAALEQSSWTAKHAQRVLKPRKVRSTMMLAEHAAHLEYQPYGVIGVIGPWNYPIFTPLGMIGGALAAGNAVVFKPSEYTPAVGQWLTNLFAEVVPEQPVWQIVHGFGDTGAALCRAGVDKVAFTGSTATGKKIMAACAETLTPVLLECGGKDAMIVDEDADLDEAAAACTWGGLTNAGQTCVGIERVYVVAPVYDAFVGKLVERAGKLTVGADDTDIGPITMPSQVDVIRRHIDDALESGGVAVLGGRDAVQPPYVRPTIITGVPEESAAVREETFGPTLTVTQVSTVDEALAKANAIPYGLGGAVFGKRRAMAVARAMRTGMASVNSTITFAGMSTLPFGGVGASGFGRIHGEDGLREFARAKAITRRRMKSLLPAQSFERTPKQLALVKRVLRMMHG